MFFQALLIIHSMLTSGALCLAVSTGPASNEQTMRSLDTSTLELPANTFMSKKAKLPGLRQQGWLTHGHGRADRTIKLLLSKVLPCGLQRDVVRFALPQPQVTFSFPHPHGEL